MNEISFLAKRIHRSRPLFARFAQSFAAFVWCAAQRKSELYVMISPHDPLMKFPIQEGQAQDWQLVVDSNLPSPEDIADPGNEHPLTSLDYEIGSRSVVVLSRRQKGASP